MADEINWEAKIAQAKAEFLKKVDWSQNAACAFVGPKGGVTSDGYATSGSVCHSFLDRAPVKFLINGLQEGSSYGDNPGRILAPEVELWFVDYILNRSPYAETFVTKDAETALKERITVSSGDHPGNLVGAGVVALRRLWEHVYVARAAYDLVQKGVNEDLAFLVAHAIQSPSDINDDTTVSWTANLNWHTSIDIGVMSFKACKNFMERKLTDPNELYSEAGRYRGYSAMYNGGKGASLSSYILTKFPTAKLHDKGPKKASTNPFTAAKPQVAVGHGKTAPYHKAISVMAEWCNTHLMEKINNA